MLGQLMNCYPKNLAMPGQDVGVSHRLPQANLKIVSNLQLCLACKVYCCVHVCVCVYVCVHVCECVCICVCVCVCISRVEKGGGNCPPHFYTSDTTVYLCILFYFY